MTGRVIGLLAAFGLACDAAVWLIDRGVSMPWMSIFVGGVAVGSKAVQWVESRR